MATLFLQNQPQGYILSYFYKLPRAFSLSPECLLNFLSNFHIPPCVREIFKFMEFTFLENALIRDIFTHAPSPLKTRPKVLVITPQAEGNYSSPQAVCFIKTFPQQQKRVEETVICFIKLQSENMKITWNIRFFIFCMIGNFL